MNKLVLIVRQKHKVSDFFRVIVMNFNPYFEYISTLDPVWTSVEPLQSLLVIFCDVRTARCLCSYKSTITLKWWCLTNNDLAPFIRQQFSEKYMDKKKLQYHKQ